MNQLVLGGIKQLAQRVERNSVFTGGSLVIESITEGFVAPYYDVRTHRVFARKVGDWGHIWMSRDYGRTWQEFYTMREGYNFEQIFALSDGSYLVWTSGAGNVVARVSEDLKTWQWGMPSVLRLQPLSTTLGCAEHDGVIMFAEYETGSNPNQRIWRSTDAVNWEIAHEDTTIRHWHSLQVDPYTGHWWAISGDLDNQSKMIRSTDGGITWDVVGEGHSSYRAIGLVFGRDEILWASDRPEGAAIYRSKREPFSPELIQSIGGASYGQVRTLDGRALIIERMESGLGPEYAGVYLTDGSEVTQIMRTAVAPGRSTGGFSRITHMDNEGRVFIGMDNTLWGENIILCVRPPLGA